MKIFRELKGIPEPEEENEKKTFFEQAEEARAGLDKTSEEKKEDPLLRNMNGLTDDMFEDELPKGSFVDHTVDDSMTTGNDGE